MNDIKKQVGFTLPELLIALTLFALVASLAAPAFMRLIERNRNQAAMHEIHAQLQQARTQAVLRKEDIELCPSQNGSQCTLDWEDWWLMRLRNNNKQLHYAAPHSGITKLRWTGFSSIIRFHSNGTSPISNGRFYICEQGRITLQIVLNRQGRIRWANPSENRRESERCL
ncbi:GspH/FimT family pseudopilin [Pseudomonas sp.]|uniref:GspH/FimT family pseudopilin n=1 Tax=Pseudomonas sp. TaxID=306 RepID=UPI003C70B328